LWQSRVEEATRRVAAVGIAIRAIAEQDVEPSAALLDHRFQRERLSVDLEVCAAGNPLRVAGRPLFVVVADLLRLRVRLPARDDAPPRIDGEVADAGEFLARRGVRIAHADPARAAALEELVSTALEEERLARRDD